MKHKSIFKYSLGKQDKDKTWKILKDSKDVGMASSGSKKSDALNVIKILNSHQKENINSKNNTMATQKTSKKKWIQAAIKKPNALRKTLKAKKGKNIPMAELKKAAKAKGLKGKRARLALTLKSFH